MRALFLAAFAAIALTSPVKAGDVSRGQGLFETYCDECHTTNRGGASRKAPNLFGLIGRATGTVPGFEYSDANRNAGWVWSATTLETYLVAPRQVIAGTTMKFKGIPDPQERQDVIAYLLSLR